MAGTLASVDGEKAFDVTGLDESFALDGWDPSFGFEDGARVKLTGELKTPPKARPRLQVTSVERGR